MVGAFVPGLQWLAPIGAVLSGGSTIRSLGGFSTVVRFGGGVGINGGAWNEQVPGGSSGGSLGGSVNGGGVFGQGQTSPFVFSFAEAGSRLAPGDVPIDNPYFYALARGVQNASPVVEPKNIAKFYLASAVAGHVAVQMTGATHVAFRVLPGGQWLHGFQVVVGDTAETFAGGGVRVVANGALRFVKRNGPGRLLLPVIRPAAVAATEGLVCSNCAAAAWKAFWAVWGFK